MATFSQTIRRIILVICCFLLFYALITACTGSQPTVPIETLEPSPDSQQEDSNKEQILQTPTPAPTATPSPLDELVTSLATTVGLNQVEVLTLTGEDWINLLISIGIILVGVTILTRLLFLIIRRVVALTKIPYDDLLLEAIGLQLGWLLWIFITKYATNRLFFLPSNLKQSMNQLYFSLYVITIVVALWKLTDFAVKVSQGSEGKAQQISTLIVPLLRRLIHFLLIIVGVTIVLSNYGVNISALVAVLGIGGLAFSLAAQDTLADTISGFIILLDQPFREGDRIAIDALNTWGDVVDIGTRTTRIRTLDNRMVIVPNSSIGKSQIVNYTYPDPRYRVDIDINIEEGVNVPHVRQVISNAVKAVDGVLQDKPVDVLFINFGVGSLIFRVRWWLSSYADTRRISDKVNEAIYNALNTAGISTPPNVIDVHLKSAVLEDNKRAFSKPDSNLD